MYLCRMEKEREIKALFFDIDGTLVSFNTHRIPCSTIEAIEAAKQKGIKIFIATGRPLVYINNLADIAHLVDGYVTTNGACIVIDGGPMWMKLTSDFFSSFCTSVASGSLYLTSSS